MIERTIVVVSASIYVLGAAIVGLWMLIGPARKGRYNGGVPPVYGAMFAPLAMFGMMFWPFVFVIAPVLNFILGPWLDRRAEFGLYRGQTSSAGTAAAPKVERKGDF